MTSSIVDSAYFGSTFRDSVVHDIFSDKSRFAAWLDVESGLARAQARLGLIPEEAAEAITMAAKVENLDIAAMSEEYQKVGFPILPLVHQLANACDKDSARWVHWGATTQDIVDTGMVLQMKEAFDILARQLDEVIDAVAKLAEDHRATVMAGRTFQQQAAPVTFGFKAAVWLDELLRHRERLPDVKRRALVCQFGGAVGTLATLGDRGTDVLEVLSRELELEEPPISWHTARDGWAEAVFWLAMVGGTLAKIATEVATLMRSEVDEVREPYTPGKGGSSTMPQKRNPVACPIIMAIGNRLREHVGSQLTAMIQEHERAVAAMPLEWMVIPEAFVLLSGSLQHSITMLSGLTVDRAKMLENLHLGGGLLMAEAVMMGLAPIIGRNQAHDLVYSSAGKAWDQGITLRDALLTDDRIRQHLSVDDVDRLINPANYTGSTEKMITKVLGRVNHD
ncbi:class-II fumarase/aspartase family protein [Halomonas sp. HL-93]|uniref:class-II fumarase/aspartase family protein n=1 Tax=Halomonas sp. HL-93 TaxID=1666906 RepID=UPI0007F0902C|nr:adenylosuccinate lyase family protein [Halomonas sp. HL-93]SBR46112.1 3-carboxy-cis,cis-muconate cycloisomerase [Halomonas sp. HL-93]